MEGKEVFLATKLGKVIRFPNQMIRESQRGGRGVMGMRLSKDDTIVSSVSINKKNSDLFIITEKGYGKRTSMKEYCMQTRGGKGIVGIKTTQRTGNVVAIGEIVENDQSIIATERGIVIRCLMNTIRSQGRNCQGVRLINIMPGDKVKSMSII